MIKTIQKPGFIILAGLILILCVIIRNQREEIEKLRISESMIQGGDIQKSELIDSLQEELYLSNMSVTRYEIALENLRYEDSIAAQKFDEQLSHTE